MFEGFAQTPFGLQIKRHLAIHVAPFVTSVAAIENHHSFCVCYWGPDETSARLRHSKKIYIAFLAFLLYISLLLDDILK